MHAATLKASTRIARAQIIASEFFDEFFVSMHKTRTALYPCLRGVAAFTLASGLESSGSCGYLYALSYPL